MCLRTSMYTSAAAEAAAATTTTANKLYKKIETNKQKQTNKQTIKTTENPEETK